MDYQTLLVIGASLGVASSIYTICEKIWGGGNKLAKAFSDSEKNNKKELDAQAAKHSAEMVALRAEFITKLETNHDNITVGINAITANIHAMQVGFAEFRAQMAENYMRRESFYKTADEMKSDFKAIIAELKGDIRSEFTEVKADLDGLAKSVEAARRERA